MAKRPRKPRHPPSSSLSPPPTELQGFDPSQSATSAINSLRTRFSPTNIPARLLAPYRIYELQRTYNLPPNLRSIASKHLLANLADPSGRIPPFVKQVLMEDRLARRAADVGGAEMLVALLGGLDRPEWEALWDVGEELRLDLGVEVGQYYMLFGDAGGERVQKKWAWGERVGAEHICGEADCDCGGSEGGE